MIVPRHWSESRVAGDVEGHRVTVRRFGWSDTSEAEAAVNAEARAREALARIAAGEDLKRRERKVAYNGADGMPIREEILSRHGDAVVTRNSYGAPCLNTPGVLFGDLDFKEGTPLSSVFRIAAMLSILAVGVAIARHSVAVGIAGVLLSLVLAPGVASLLKSWRTKRAGGEEAIVRKRLERFLAARPDWHLRLYRTPAGFRVLAMHRCFDPLDPEVESCFAELEVDPVYARMCRNQHCFRARLGPKPWRAGYQDPDRRRLGVWPVPAERLPLRTRWVEGYERVAARFASCRFIGTFGRGGVDETARSVQELHDAACKAHLDLPLA